MGWPLVFQCELSNDISYKCAIATVADSSKNSRDNNLYFFGLQILLTLQFTDRLILFKKEKFSPVLTFSLPITPIFIAGCYTCYTAG